MPSDVPPSRRMSLLLVLASLFLLIPFVNKPVHVDDTVYLWVAEQIRAEPLDFYGFDKNWDGRLEPVHAFNKNPPGLSYFLALPDWIGGGREWVLHLAMLLPACAAVLGIYRLAQTLGARGAIAAAVLLVSPAFLVSATTLMADVLALAFYVWGVALWVAAARGDVRTTEGDHLLEGERTCEPGPRGLAFAASLIALAILTKYVAVTALPLLAVYTFLQTRLPFRTRLRRLGWLLVPLATLVFYEIYTAQKYGTGMFAEAVDYSSAYSIDAMTSRVVEQGLTALSFLGAGFLPAALFIPWMWGVRGTFAWLAVAVLIGFSLAVTGGFDSRYLLYEVAALRWGYILQLSVAIAGGAHILALATVDMWQKRDATSLLLALWVGGIFIFAAFLNWSVNIRSLLPATPAVALLVARRLDLRAAHEELPRLYRLPITIGAVISLAVAWADYHDAAAYKRVAAIVAEQYGGEEGAVWFQGHWGFQHYMEQHGFQPFDYGDAPDASGYDDNVSLAELGLRPGEIAVVPVEHRSYAMPSGEAELIETFAVSDGQWAATMDRKAGAGFYMASWGLLPYFFGPNPSKLFELYRVVR